jgi:NAD(P)-dependent dehydrogenase (short-subunit alcohol dehydrogenase family)
MTFSDYEVAVVTGATSGVGRGAIDLFLSKGLTVHAIARDEKRLAELADRGVIAHALDVRDTDALTRALEGVEADIVLNSAGVSRAGNLLSSSAEDLDDLVEVNLTAVMQILRRNTMGVDTLEPWVHRIGAAANPFRGPADHDPYAVTAAPQAFLRALFLHLSLGHEPPAVRPDLLLVVIEALRMTNGPYLRVDTR